MRTVCKVSSCRLKENYILLSTDGPGKNVLKFKPPMCFSLDNAQHVVAKLDDILTGKLGRIPVEHVSGPGFNPQH